MARIFEMIDLEAPRELQELWQLGFTIYRTHYSPEHWDMLLDDLKRQTDMGAAYYLGFYQNQDEYRDDLKRLKKLFRLDPRQDPSLLDGLDIRQLREAYLNEHPTGKRLWQDAFSATLLSPTRQCSKSLPMVILLSS
ncbi:hypothetical protein QQZ08_010277 [Neonectria magnoliae]|uniref:Uncharacterized protein n=1 Tax=Neonectria magnoliae TaxID=2732573 RepID=A0ABR1HHM7_9HYPO